MAIGMSKYSTKIRTNLALIAGNHFLHHQRERKKGPKIAGLG